MRHRLPRFNEPVDMRIIWRLLPAFAVSFLTVIVMLANYYSASVAGHRRRSRRARAVGVPGTVPAEARRS
jgi:hypothetical protein